MNAWINFRNKHSPLAADISIESGSESQCYVFQVKKAIGIQTPNIQRGSDITHLVNVHFFHITSKTFFGQTWTSPETIAIRSSGGKLY